MVWKLITSSFVDYQMHGKVTAPPDIKLQLVMGLRRFLGGRSRTILFADLYQHAKKPSQH